MFHSSVVINKNQVVNFVYNKGQSDFKMAGILNARFSTQNFVTKVVSSQIISTSARRVISLPKFYVPTAKVFVRYESLIEYFVSSEVFRFLSVSKLFAFDFTRHLFVWLSYDYQIHNFIITFVCFYIFYIDII